MGRESRCDLELTQTPGSIDRGVISLGTLAEVAANGIIAFTHATKTRNVRTLIQICEEERMETRHGPRMLNPKTTADSLLCEQNSTFLEALIIRHGTF